MNRFLKAIRAIGHYIAGGKYISSFKAINGSVWWENEEKKLIASYDEILTTTAIGLVTTTSAHIYFPRNIKKVQLGQTVKYVASLRLYTIMKKEYLQDWIEQTADYPFI